MQYTNKISIPLSNEDKNFIEKKASETRQTMSSFVRSRIFERTDLRSENEVPF